MERIIRQSRLTSEEAAKYRDIRSKIAAEVPELVERHHRRMESLRQLEALFPQLKAAREAQGLDLESLNGLTEADVAAISKLEEGKSANPTLQSLVHYADAVGKHLVVQLADK